jgi:hypothetical protein
MHPDTKLRRNGGKYHPPHAPLVLPSALYIGDGCQGPSRSSGHSKSFSHSEFIKSARRRVHVTVVPEAYTSKAALLSGSHDSAVWKSPTVTRAIAPGRARATDVFVPDIRSNNHPKRHGGSTAGFQRTCVAHQLRILRPNPLPASSSTSQPTYAAHWSARSYKSRAIDPADGVFFNRDCAAAIHILVIAIVAVFGSKRRPSWFCK